MKFLMKNVVNNPLFYMRKSVLSYHIDLQFFTLVKQHGLPKGNTLTMHCRTFLTHLPTKEENLSKMNALLPTIVDYVAEPIQEIFVHDSKLKDKLNELLTYNSTGGKMTRSMVLLTMYQMLTKKNLSKTEDTIYYLAWCLELFQGYATLLDDIVDNGEYRRNKLSWYFKTNKNLLVAYDGMILYESVYILLKKFFSNHKYYTELVESFHMINMRLNYGQILDNLSFSFEMEPKTLSSYAKELYKLISINKCSYYTFYSPIILALYLSECFTPKREKLTKHFATELGHLAQIQNDYWDCYGNVAVTGKMCTDIGAGTFSWLLTEAVSCCDESQLEKLKKNYGQNEEDKINAVKGLYDELGLEQKITEIEKMYFVLQKEVQDLPDEMLSKSFEKILFISVGRYLNLTP